MPDLSPIRGEVTVLYDAAFMYLSVRGAIAERWGHGSGFGRHTIGHDNLGLMNKQGSRIAQLNLKSNTFVEAGPRLNWKTFVSEASEFSVDCLKTLQPRVSGIIADVRLMSRARSFSSERDRLSSALLCGNYGVAPTPDAAFDDLSVTLQFKRNLLTVATDFGPMRPIELGQHIEGEQDLGAFPESFLFVRRRYQLAPGPDPETDRLDWQQALQHLESLVTDYLSSAPHDVSEYALALLGGEKSKR